MNTIAIGLWTIDESPPYWSSLATSCRLSVLCNNYALQLAIYIVVYKLALYIDLPLATISRVNSNSMQKVTIFHRNDYK